MDVRKPDANGVEQGEGPPAGLLIIFRHCRSNAILQKNFDGVCRLCNRFIYDDALCFAKVAEHEIGKIANRMIGRDTNAQTGEGLRPDFFDDRFQAVLAASTAVWPQAQLTNGQSRFITDYQNAISFDLVLSHQSRHGDAAQIHERLWLDQQRLCTAKVGFGCQRLTFRRAHVPSSAAGEFINYPKAAIVARTVVLLAGIA